MITRRSLHFVTQGFGQRVGGVRILTPHHLARDIEGEPGSCQ